LYIVDVFELCSFLKDFLFGGNYQIGVQYKGDASRRNDYLRVRSLLHFYVALIVGLVQDKNCLGFLDPFKVQDFEALVPFLTSPLAHRGEFHP
jgi:hypothetical protein